MISEKKLINDYIIQGKSVSKISSETGCSQGQINYWISKYNITKRTIASALYLKHNPNGDPFIFNRPKSNKEWFLYGLGLGLFWGEGNKVNKNSVRLGNTDPDLIKTFLTFLREIYNVDEKKLRFGLQLFQDISESEAKSFWIKKIGIKESQFHKVTMTKPIQKGTYNKKCKYGVLMIYFSNTKLRDIIMSAIFELHEKPM